MSNHGQFCVHDRFCFIGRSADSVRGSVIVEFKRSHIFTSHSALEEEDEDEGGSVTGPTYRAHLVRKEKKCTSHDGDVKTRGDTGSPPFFGPVIHLRVCGSRVRSANYRLNNARHNYRAMCTSPNRLASFNPTSWRQ